MVTIIMAKLTMAKLTMNKVNMTKLTNEYIFYGKTNYSKNNE
jgi:hypothetical protein